MWNLSSGKEPRFMVWMVVGVVIVGLGVGLVPGVGYLEEPPKLAVYANEDISFKTETKFSFEEEVEEEVLDYEVTNEVDGEMDMCGDEVMKQEGKNGMRKRYFEISMYEGELIGRDLVKTEVEKALPEIRVIGGKKIYKEVEIDGKRIQAWCGLGQFRATAYDANCKGCSGTTAIGLRAGFGVVAVDPKVIPLESRVYVSGYGEAIAGDTGGSVKGKRIDLGFEKVERSWGVRGVEVWML